MNLDLIAFSRIYAIYNNRDYNELYDILYNYMVTYVNHEIFDNYLFLEEARAVLGLKNHDDIIDYILNMD